MTAIMPAVIVWGFFWINLAVDDWGTPNYDFTYFYKHSECREEAEEYAKDNALKNAPDCIRMTEEEARHERWLVEEQRRGQGA